MLIDPLVCTGLQTASLTPYPGLLPPGALKGVKCTAPDPVL